MSLAQIFMGWPALLGSLGLSIFGIVRKSPGWLIGGAFLSVGFAFYLTMWPILVVSSVGYTLPFLHLGGAVALHFRKPWIAWSLLSPHALMALFLAAVVLIQ